MRFCVEGMINSPLPDSGMTPVGADGAALQLRVGDGAGHPGACGLVVDAGGVVSR